MPLGLPVSRVVSVSISLTPPGAAYENFDTLLIMGDSNVIDTYQRIRSYNSIAEVEGDFGTTAPEFYAAEIFFSQSPEPTQVYIGRWAKTATAGSLVCGVLSGAQQAMSNWTPLTNGSFTVSIDGTPADVTGLNFSTQTNLNGVAAVIQTGLQNVGGGGFSSATCKWFAQEGQFVITSGVTGTLSTVSFLTAGGGVDISAQLKGTAATADYAVAGIAAESAITAVTILDQLPTQWYALMFAAGSNNGDIADSDYLAIAAYIEASGPSSGNPHMFGLVTSETTALEVNNLTDIGSELMAAGYDRTFCQYSSESAYAEAGIFGILLTVNLEAQNSMINVMWKQIAGVTYETLTATQADSLDSKRYNYYTLFNNGVAIIVNGMMAANAYIDEIFGMDAFANRIQTDVFNLMVTTPTKIPQTDPGMHDITVTIQSSCAAYVYNGFLAPGTWTAAGFGSLNPGDTLSKGYYVYAPPVATQSIATRSARQSVTFMVAAKESGAVNDVLINALVNR